MWYYIQVSHYLSSLYLGISVPQSIELFNKIGGFVFKSSYKCENFQKYIIKEVYLMFGKFIIENNYQNYINDIFCIRSADIVYDNFATQNKFRNMFNLNPSLLCQGEDISSEVHADFHVVDSAGNPIRFNGIELEKDS